MSPDLPFSNKVIPIGDIATWRQNAEQFGRTVVATNGCFDLWHGGALPAIGLAVFAQNRILESGKKSRYEPGE